ncbi:hypothetical protein PI125_g27296, partial [Phytophthora idaei]
MLEVALVKSVADSEQATNSVSVPEATVLQSVELVRPQTDSWLMQVVQAASVLRVLEWEVQWSQLLAMVSGVLKMDLVLATLVPVLEQAVLPVPVPLVQEGLLVLVGSLERVASDEVSSEVSVPVVSSEDSAANLAVAWEDLTGALEATVV